jgi:alpha-tubulin suppressor-like RCC1 family protein
MRMKKIIYLLILNLFLLSCNNTDSGSESENKESLSEEQVAENIARDLENAGCFNLDQCSNNEDQEPIICGEDYNYTIQGEPNSNLNLSLQEDVNLKKIISSGLGNTCALKVDGSVKCWGKNSYNKNTSHVNFNSNFISISTYKDNTCGIRIDNEVWCWGKASNGKFPVSTSVTNDFTHSSNMNVKNVSVGGDGFLCLLNESNQTYCAGDSTMGKFIQEQEDLTGYVAITSGYSHSCAIKESDGEISCFGWHGGCRLSAPPKKNSEFVALSSSIAHSCALKSNGRIVCWGRNLDGESNVPTGQNYNFISVSTGSFHTCGLRNTGEVVCWGANNFNQLDIPESNSDFIAIDAGDYHTCAVKSSGSISCWGKDSSSNSFVVSKVNSDDFDNTGFGRP